MLNSFRPKYVPFVLLPAAVIAIGCLPGSIWAAPTGEMIELTLAGQRVEGVPLLWTEQMVHLLGRDGRLWQFSPEEASGYKKTSAHFRAYSPSELRAVLLRELGNGYEVSGTSHYLIAHPANCRDKWAERFEDLYRSFSHYFSVRGFQISPPPFPLVGVVARNHDDFVHQITAQNGPSGKGVQGLYNVELNRITLYDMGVKTNSADWRQNAAVLIHEATHQMAFNTGVHSRYCLPPTWLAEGLATLFEAPGVYNAQANGRPSDRVNRERLTDFRRIVAPRHQPQLLAAIVASDDPFRASVGVAYAESWALTFFLTETEPHKYAAYL